MGRGFGTYIATDIKAVAIQAVAIQAVAIQAVVICEDNQP
jgi:hypothetical protein